MKEEKRGSGKKWKRLSEERGWADVSYFSKIQRGCPVGSLPRPLLWNALTHSRRQKDRQLASKNVRKNVTQKLGLCLTHLYWISSLHLALLLSYSIFSGHIFFLNFVPFPLTSLFFLCSVTVGWYNVKISTFFTCPSQKHFASWSLTVTKAFSHYLWFCYCHARLLLEFEMLAI